MAEGDNIRVSSAKIGSARVGRMMVERVDGMSGETKTLNNDLIREVTTAIERSHAGNMKKLEELTREIRRFRTNGGGGGTGGGGGGNADAIVRRLDTLINLINQGGTGRGSSSSGSHGNGPSAHTLHQGMEETNKLLKGIGHILLNSKGGGKSEHGGSTNIDPATREQFQTGTHTAQRNRRTKGAQLLRSSPLAQARANMRQSMNMAVRANLHARQGMANGNITAQQAILNYGSALHHTGNALKQFQQFLSTATGGLVNFSNTISFVKSRFGPVGDKTYEKGTFMYGTSAGVGGLNEAMLDDLLRVLTLGISGRGDSLAETMGMIGKLAEKVNEFDTRLLVQGRSVQDAAAAIRNLRGDVRKSGFDTDAVMTFREANESLLSMATMMKRAGMIDDLRDRKVADYAANQLKVSHLVAMNTGLTVKRIEEMNRKNEQRLGELKAGGVLTNDAQVANANSLSKMLVSSPELQKHLMGAAQYGSVEQYMGSMSDDERRSFVSSGGMAFLKELMEGGVYGAQRQLTPQELNELIMRAKARGQAGAIQSGPHTGMALQGAAGQRVMTELNGLGSMEPKGGSEPTKGTVRGTLEGLRDFFTNKIPVDAVKGLIGMVAVPVMMVTQIRLLAQIVANTGGLSGILGGGLKGIAGKAGGMLSKIPGLSGIFGGGAAAAGAAGAAGAIPGAAGAAGAAGRGILGGLGRGVLSKIPILGALMGVGSKVFDIGDSVVNTTSKDLPDSAQGWLQRLISDTMSDPVGPLGAINKQITDFTIAKVKDWLGFGGDKTNGAAAPAGAAGALVQPGGIRDINMPGGANAPFVSPVPPDIGSPTADPRSGVVRFQNGINDRFDIQIRKMDELIAAVNRLDKGGAGTGGTSSRVEGARDQADKEGGIFGFVSRLWG